jgi:hypothetical protein
VHGGGAARRVIARVLESALADEPQQVLEAQDLHDAVAAKR